MHFVSSRSSRGQRPSVGSLQYPTVGDHLLHTGPPPSVMGWGPTGDLAIIVSLAETPSEDEPESHLNG
jgi:hypothetical protein